MEIITLVHPDKNIKYNYLIKMRIVPTIIATILALTVHGQNENLTFTNNQHAYYNKSGLQEFWGGPQINEIELKSDSTFEFWSRPNESCFTWRQYKGTWKKEKDTILFYNHYEIVESDIMVTYKRGNEKNYHIKFLTDKNSSLKNKAVKIKYVYDNSAHLEDIEKTFYLDADNFIEILFQDIPDLNKLASFKIEYLLNYTEKRFAYLTENRFVNIRRGDLPNIIEVKIIESPKKETVYRKIKGVVHSDMLLIISNTKNKIAPPEYGDEIMFENSYSLSK
jgi:hypothetical protein